MWHSSTTTATTFEQNPSLSNKVRPRMVLRRASGWQKTKRNLPAMTSSKLWSEFAWYSLPSSVNSLSLVSIFNLHDGTLWSESVESWSFWIMFRGDITITMGWFSWSVFNAWTWVFPNWSLQTRNLHTSCGVITVKSGECGNCDRNNCNQISFKLLVFLADFLFSSLFWSLCNLSWIARRSSP